MAGTSGHPHPIAANVQYVSPPATAAGEVEVEVLRAGRFASQARARLVQEGQARVEAMFTLGTLTAGAAPRWGQIPAVVLPPLEECRRLERMGGTGGRSLRDVMEQRFDPTTLGFLDGAPSGGGELRAWFQFADGRHVDPLALLFAVDAIPPATFDIVSTGWVPTLNLTAYVRAVPEPGPLKMRMRANVIADEVVDEVCEVWDSTDRLVAQSTQLAGIRLPEVS